MSIEVFTLLDLLSRGWRIASLLCWIHIFSLVFEILLLLNLYLISLYTFKTCLLYASCLILFAGLAGGRPLLLCITMTHYLKLWRLINSGSRLWLSLRIISTAKILHLDSLITGTTSVCRVPILGSGTVNMSKCRWRLLLVLSLFRHCG
jgi:hypothetical protein